MEALRHADVLLHVLRWHENDDIVHYDGSLDPIKDFQIVYHELLLMVLTHS